MRRRTFLKLLGLAGAVNTPAKAEPPKLVVDEEKLRRLFKAGYANRIGKPIHLRDMEPIPGLPE